MTQYLASCQYINWQQPDVLAKAFELSAGLSAHLEIAQACFEFVRDEIKHSWDHQLNTVTCIASDVLQHSTGYCYAKSHLLAALLRANNIPAGLCYQRLTIADNKPPFCLHGLNAVYLKDLGWYRIDARGNKVGVDAQFTPPQEQLAFPTILPGECDITGIWPAPLAVIIDALNPKLSVLEVAEKLPDIEILT